VGVGEDQSLTCLDWDTVVLFCYLYLFLLCAFFVLVLVFSLCFLLVLGRVFVVSSLLCFPLFIIFFLLIEIRYTSKIFLFQI
jgi:hypothetical protein